MRNAIVFFVIAVLGYAAWAHYKSGNKGGPPGGMGMPAAQVEVAEVKEREVQLWNEFSGRLAAVDAAEIRPRVSGPVESVNFKNGAAVQKGDLLFVIDPKPYKSEVARLKGLLASAEAQEALAQTEFSRTEGLFQSKAISQREFDQRRNDLNVAIAAKKSAEAALEAAQLNLDYTEVKAPITGRAGRAEVTVGNMVQAGPNAPMLTMIASISPIYAEFEMDEATYLRYAKATAAERARIPVRLGLATETGTPHEGRIESFDNRLDSASGTIRVRALFDNADGALVPGLFARIRIADAAPSKVLLINDRAVGTDQDKKFVLAVNAENKAEYRQVKLGPPAEGLRVVEEGLNAGDKIIISGLLPTMHPGIDVVPQLVAMDAPPQAPAPPVPNTGNTQPSTDNAPPPGDNKK
ncbi:MAG: efflux RND transporter periplasmic adaptor subunit [Alphaproteobacteria bacterium]|nr:MAG: efflux RND transporter periplasmic adaptor subunit [Alphaproteobacteria bacterium]